MNTFVTYCWATTIVCLLAIAVGSVMDRYPRWSRPIGWAWDQIKRPFHWLFRKIHA